MPSITETSSSVPRRNGRPGQPSHGRPNTRLKSTICALRSIGHFRRTAIRPIGVALTAVAVPVWMHLSLLEECRRRVEQALAALAAVTEPDARQQMKLLAALGASRLYTRGGVPEVASAWTRALELAESLENTEYQKRSLWGLWSFHVNGFDYRTALSLALAHRFASLVATSLDPNGRSNPPGTRNGEESMARTVTEKHHRPAEPLSTRHVFLDTQSITGSGTTRPIRLSSR
jgi:hypothetical protein